MWKHHLGLALIKYEVFLKLVFSLQMYLAVQMMVHNVNVLRNS